MPNYVPTWDGDTMAFPCQQCGRRLRKVSVGYICDRCRLVLGETTITQGETIEKAEAAHEDANGQDAEGQEDLLTS